MRVRFVLAIVAACVVAAWSCAPAGAAKAEEVKVERQARPEVVDASVPATEGMPVHLTLKMSDVEEPGRGLFVVPWYGDNPENHASYFKNTVFQAGPFVLQVAASSQKVEGQKGAFCWTDRDMALREISDAWDQAARFGIPSEGWIAFGSSQGAAPLLELVLSGRIQAKGVIVAVPYLADKPEPYWSRSIEDFIAYAAAGKAALGTRFVFVTGASDDFAANDRRLAEALEAKGYATLVIETTGGHAEILAKAANAKFAEALAFIEKE